MAKELIFLLAARLPASRLLLLLLAHRGEVDEDAKVGRLKHRLVAEGRAVGVRGAPVVTNAITFELPHPLAIVPLERRQPDLA